jgi:hypothetical protein
MHGSPFTVLDNAAVALQASCASVWRSSYYEFIVSQLANGVLPWAGTASCASTWIPTNSKVTMCWSVDEENVGIVTAPPFQFTASKPCCSICTFTAGDVRVYYWPPSASTPLVSRLVNSNDFTFYVSFNIAFTYQLLKRSSTYPSVYIAIETILATDMCGQVGSAIDNLTTIEFDATELSTAASYFYPSNWSSSLVAITSQDWWTYSGINWEDRCARSYLILIAKDNDLSKHELYGHRKDNLDRLRYCYSPHNINIVLGLDNLPA